MNWNIGEFKNLISQSEIKIATLIMLYFTTIRSCTETLTLTVNEMQQTPETEKTESGELISAENGLSKNADEKHV